MSIVRNWIDCLSMPSVGRKEIPPDDLILQRVKKAIAGGRKRHEAAAIAGIARDTFSEWMRRGLKEPGTKYAAFRQVVVEAEDSLLGDALACVKSASFDDWKAAAWLLTHRFRSSWGDDAGKSTKSETTKTSSVDDLSLAELNSEIARLESKLGKAVTG